MWGTFHIFTVSMTKYSSHLDWMWGIFCIILSVRHNIVMALNNVMLVVELPFICKIGALKKAKSGLLDWVRLNQFLKGRGRGGFTFELWPLWYGMVDMTPLLQQSQWLVQKLYLLHIGSFTSLQEFVEKQHYEIWRFFNL
jgi:hypothetical protein